MGEGGGQKKNAFENISTRSCDHEEDRSLLLKGTEEGEGMAASHEPEGSWDDGESVEGNVVSHGARTMFPDHALTIVGGVRVEVKDWVPEGTNPLVFLWSSFVFGLAGAVWTR